MNLVKSLKRKDNQHNDTIKTQSKHPTITEESYTSTKDKESIHTEKNKCQLSNIQLK